MNNIEIDEGFNEKYEDDYCVWLASLQNESHKKQL